MSLITEPILQGNFERIRSQIAAILASELASQRTINQSLLDAQLALPAEEQNQTLISQYQLNLDSIPNRVYEERTTRFTSAEGVMVNVINLGVPTILNTTNSDQICMSEFMVEVFHTGSSSESGEGDYKSALKRDRLINICWKIIQDKNYIRLGITDGTTGFSNVTKNAIANIQEGANDSDYISYASLTIEVKHNEAVSDYAGIPLLESEAVVQINEFDKGFAWLYVEDLVGDEVITINREILTLNEENLTIN